MLNSFPKITKTAYLVYSLLAGLFLLSGCFYEDANDLPTPLDDTPVIREVEIDASNATEWAYFSFTTESSVIIDDPASSLEWDIGLRKTICRTNGGTSGPGQGNAINLGSGSLDLFMEAPTTGYTNDQIIDDEELGGFVSASLVLAPWADDRSHTATIEPTLDIFSVRTAEGGFAIICYKDYYSESGDPGVINFQYILVEGMDNEMTIDASNYEDWVYFSFAQGRIVEIDEPLNSLDWDLGLRRYHLRTNSGSSGPGQGGALNLGPIAWSEATTAPEEGYCSDEIQHIPGHGGGEDISINGVLKEWGDMDFDQMPHVFTPSNSIFVIRMADETYGKLWLKNYYNSIGESGRIGFRFSHQADGSHDLSQ